MYSTYYVHPLQVVCLNILYMYIRIIIGTYIETVVYVCIEVIIMYQTYIEWLNILYMYIRIIIGTYIETVVYVCIEVIIMYQTYIEWLIAIKSSRQKAQLAQQDGVMNKVNSNVLGASLTWHICTLTHTLTHTLSHTHIYTLTHTLSHTHTHSHTDHCSSTEPTGNQRSPSPSPTPHPPPTQAMHTKPYFCTIALKYKLQRKCHINMYTLFMQ